MLTHLKLDNFKIWRSTGPIRLAPITLLLGTNSSGKSSLIQSLLLLRQTTRSTDLHIDLYFGKQENNDSVVLGQFKDVLCRHGAANEVMSAKKIGIEFSWIAERGQKPTVFTTRYRAGFYDGAEIEYLRLGPEGAGFTVSRVRDFMFKLQVADEKKSRGVNRFFRPEKSFSLPPQAIAKLADKGPQLSHLCTQLQDQLEKIIYLGPVRSMARRDYTWSGRWPTQLDDNGVNAINALITSGVLNGGHVQEKNRKPVPSNSESLWHKTIMWLKLMNLATDLKIQRLGKSDRYELLIVNGEDCSNLKDVGVGVSQVLPVIVAALVAKTGHIVILEEPESHLHPLAQSQLAELFYYASDRRGVQFIVETHSEHLFRRMQTLIAKRRITPHDAAMYFVERDGRNAKLRELVPNEFGAIEWPDKFFGDAIGEAREQAKARLLTTVVRSGEQ